MGGYFDNGKGHIRRGINDRKAEVAFNTNWDLIDWGTPSPKPKQAKRKRRKAK